MAVLEYKLEYFKGADEGCYIQLRTEVPAYQHIIAKEVYFSTDNKVHSDFCTAVFNVPGVVRLSSQAWRLYIEKSPVFTWSEVLGPVMAVLMEFTDCTSLHELQGSGVTLTSDTDRRSF